MSAHKNWFYRESMYLVSQRLWCRLESCSLKSSLEKCTDLTTEQISLAQNVKMQVPCSIRSSLRGKISLAYISWTLHLFA